MRSRKLVLAAMSAFIIGTPPGYAPESGWRDQGACYEIFVRSFSDSDGNGIGDIRGLMSKLPYLKNLGVKCLWLMPIAQSPSYHGYDVSDYYTLNRDYGTNADFRAFMAAAHQQGIIVIGDLVLNHISSQHPYFQSALHDGNSPYRDWFIWTRTPHQPRDWQSNVWHKVPDRDEYYYGLFWAGMPDLNLGNEAVKEETRRIARFWLRDMNLDGFRFDAPQQFFEDADSSRNAPAVHPWLRDYEAYIRSVKPSAFTVGEMWDSTRYVALYYPDQLETYFNLQIADALVDAARSGSKRRLVGAVEDAERDLPHGRYATFLRNHDQTRTMTELGGDVRRAKLAATLLLTLPGIPFVYYGEETGMTGTKPDERLRTPMAWDTTPGLGFTRSPTAWESRNADSMTANIGVQDRDSASLLNHYRRMIHLRSRTPALGRSQPFAAIETNNDALLAFTRGTGRGRVIVLANLSADSMTVPAGVLPAGRTTMLQGNRLDVLGPLETVIARY